MKTKSEKATERDCCLNFTLSLSPKNSNTEERRKQEEVLCSDESFRNKIKDFNNSYEIEHGEFGAFSP